jgi:hypothetical protein
MKRPISALAVCLAAIAGLAGTMHASQINTGGAAGAYHQSFCPVLEGQLRTLGRDYPCATSEGTRENMERVLKDPRQLGYGQLDVFSLESTALGQRNAFQIVRRDDARECLFAATRDKSITSWNDIAANANRLKFVLPPKGSGSNGTFQFLRMLDRDGLDRARDVSEAPNTDEAIRQALGADGTVTLFVQFADPENDRFKAIRSLGGHVVPVIDRTILAQAVDGQRIYYAQETQIETPRWLKDTPRLVTACTPMVLFTGHPQRLQEGFARRDQQDMIEALQLARGDAFMPAETAYQRVMKRSRELSAVSLDRVLDFAERAKEKARPQGAR